MNPVNNHKSKTLFSIFNRLRRTTKTIILAIALGVAILIYSLVVFIFLPLSNNSLYASQLMRNIDANLIQEKYAIVSMSSLVDFNWSFVEFTNIDILFYQRLVLVFYSEDHNVVKYLILPGSVIYPVEDDHFINSPLYKKYDIHTRFLIDHTKKPYYRFETITSEAFFFCKNVSSLISQKRALVDANFLLEMKWTKLEISKITESGYRGNNFLFSDKTETVEFILPNGFVKIPELSVNQILTIRADDSISLIQGSDSFSIIETSRKESN